MQTQWQNQTRITEVLQECAQLAVQAGSAMRWYLLIDTAFDHANHRLPFQAARTFNCYHQQRQPLHDLAAVAPCLIDCTVNSSENETRGSLDLSLLEQALRHCSTSPMLSILQTEHTARQLIQQWAGLHMMQHVELGEYLLRIADTRRLPAIAHILAPSQWAAWTQGINQWHIINRAGHLQKIALLQDPISPATAPLTLTDAQLDAMVADGEIDTYIHLVNDKLKDNGLRAPRLTPYGLYHLTQQAVQLAHEFAIDSQPDIIALIMEVWSHQENTTAHLRHILAQKAWQTGQLGPYLADNGRRSQQ